MFDHNLEIVDYSNFSFSDFEYLYPDENSRKIAEQEYNADRILYLKKIRNTQYGVWTALYGILCLAPINNDELMWAHYAKNSGFLLEFDHTKFNKENFLGPFPINYLKSLEKIDFGKLITGFEDIDTNKLLNTIFGFSIASLIKKAIWKYEDEYRYLCLPDNKRQFKVHGHFSNNETGQDLYRTD